MSDNWANRALYALLSVMCLPVACTHESPRRWVRVLGFLAVVPWFLVFMWLGLIAVPLMMIDIFLEEIWQ